jgi:hypothetical protein
MVLDQVSYSFIRSVLMDLEEPGLGH